MLYQDSNPLSLVGMAILFKFVGDSTLKCAGHLYVLTTKIDSLCRLLADPKYCGCGT